MRRVRIERPKPRRDTWWLDPLPLDPRDPDIVRAKNTIYSTRMSRGKANR
jgi:hypothetical protein